MSEKTLEICCDGINAVREAVNGGADRLELCIELKHGGLTPPAELIRAAVTLSPVPVFVLVRNRPGNFHYSAKEITDMNRSIDMAISNGAEGIVLGALDQNRAPDWKALQSWRKTADNTPVTFHRAIDEVSGPLPLQQLSDTGISRLLTTGVNEGGLSAKADAKALANLIEKLPAGLNILACGGIRPNNLDALKNIDGLREIHSAATSKGKFQSEKSIVKALKLKWK